MDPVSNSVFSSGICKQLLVLTEVLRKTRKLETKKLSSYFGIFLFYLEDNLLLCFQIAKLKQLDCEKNFLGAFASWCFSVLALHNVKNVAAQITIYVRFVPTFLRCFCVKWMKFAETGNKLFDRHQLISVSLFCKSISRWCRPMQRNCQFRIPAMKTLVTLLIQPIRCKDVFSVNWKWTCGLVVKGLLGSLSHYKDLCWQFHESEAFNLYTTFSVQIQNLFFFWNSFLLTVEMTLKTRNKFTFSDKLFSYQGNLLHMSNFSWPPVALSREFFPFDWLSQSITILGEFFMHLISFLKVCSRFLGWKNRLTSGFLVLFLLW